MGWMICQLGNVGVPKLIRQTKHKDILIPTYVADRMKRNTVKKVNRLLYPNYVFVKDFDAFEFLKRSFPDISLLTYKERVGNTTIAIKFHIIDEEKLQLAIDNSMEIIRRKQPFELKDMIKVISGPFAGQTSKAIAISENKVKLELSLFNRKIFVDFYKNDVEKV